MAAAAPASPWAPLRIRVYRTLWIAQFTSNVGTWMQTVGAQWLMGSLSHNPLLVAMIQTATALPVFLVALPAGALGDILDRRRLLLVSQSFMLVAAAGLSALTLGDATTPAILLLFTFCVGLGQALYALDRGVLRVRVLHRREELLGELLGHVDARHDDARDVPVLHLVVDPREGERELVVRERDVREVRVDARKVLRLHVDVQLAV